MVTALAIGVPLVVIGAFGALAVRYGHDSRAGFDERTPLA